MTGAILRFSPTQEEAVLALRGAEMRVAKAECCLADFLAEFGPAASQCDYQVLLVERDDALRQLAKAKSDLAEIGECR